MLKPLKDCKKDPERKVRVRKVGNVRQAEFNNSYIIFQDGDKERLLQDVDKYLKGIKETSGVDVKIKRRKSWREYPKE